ncbi:MarR family winged helix-turn-helix transcriptional regulator [Azospirillum sp. ST 5-10]|uniref:MarR family winged helix-turn-helix transcriptional regulator n=1 Tax=unclassified Azospirillum TaxID=2630922 RepID=UPI003F4A1532
MDFSFIGDLVSFRIRLVQIAAFKDFEEGLRRFGVVPRYFGLLTLIENNPGMPQARLAEAVHLMRSSLVPILDKLEAEGLVARRDSPTDRRAKGVWLTAKGAKALARIRPLVRQHEERLTHGMTEEEKAALLGLLRRVDDNLRQAKAARSAA